MIGDAAPCPLAATAQDWTYRVGVLTLPRLFELESKEASSKP